VLKSGFYFFLIFLLYCNSPKVDKLCDFKSQNFRNEFLFRVLSSNRQPFCFIQFNEKITQLNFEPDSSYTIAKFLSATNSKIPLEPAKSLNLDTVNKNITTDNYNFRTDKINLSVSIAYPEKAHEIYIQNQKLSNNQKLNLNLEIGQNQFSVRVIENEKITDYKVILNRNKQFIYLATGNDSDTTFTYQYGSIDQTTGQYTKSGQNILLNDLRSCTNPGFINQIISDITGKYILMICGRIGTDVPNAGQNIFSFKVENDGSLKLVSGGQSEIQDRRNPISIMFHPNNKFFYVGNILASEGFSKQRISVFSFDPNNGSFRNIAYSDNCQTSALASIAIDQNGKWLYALTESSNAVHTICNYEINQDGTLKTNSSQTSSPSISGNLRLYLKTTPDNSFLVATYQDNLTETYSINETTGVINLVGNISTVSSGSLAIPNQFPNSTRYIQFGGTVAAGTNQQNINRALLNSNGSFTHNFATDFFNDTANSTGRLNLLYDLTDSYLYSANQSSATNQYRMTQFSVNKQNGIISNLSPAFISETPSGTNRILKAMFILY
jgi:hypothetical protein